MMENWNQRIYDSSSSSGSSSNELSDFSDDPGDEEYIGDKVVKRKYNLSDEAEKIPGYCNKKQNILFKLYNRERRGYFASNQRTKRTEYAFNKVPKRLSFCLKEIVPYCYLKGHVFMGLTVCGQFLLSYKVSYHEETNSNVYNFNTEYKYELYFWIYRPHQLLGKYYKVCLFDDHGVDNFKVVTMTQWIENPRTLVIHGASEVEEGNSHITIVAVPKLGCLDCKVMRDDYSDDYFRCDALCIKCNMTIHTKYSRTDCDPKFLPRMNLCCPNKIIMMGNGFIHMIHLKLEVPKIATRVYTSADVENAFASPATVPSSSSATPSMAGSLISSSQQHSTCEELTPNVATSTSHDISSINYKKISHMEHHYKSDDSNNKFSNHGCDSDNKIFNRNSIVEKIIADFAECETDCQPPAALVMDKNQIRIDSTASYLNCGPKAYDELVITCPASSSEADGSADGANQLSKKSTSSNIRLVSHNVNKIRKVIRKCPTSGADTTSSPNTSKQIYEFSEDNENCEKISTFRKRRLADKKYEFSDYNSENIIPFNINLRKRITPNQRMYSSPTRSAPASASTSTTLPSSSSHHQQTALTYGLFNPTPPNYEITSHLHRASPSHGFRSPCGSPVGNRCLRSPPGFKPNYLNSRSPTTSALTLSPRQLSKKPNYDSLDNTLHGFQSPVREEIKFAIHQSSENGKGAPFKDSTTTDTSKESDKPICSKKFVRRFVEEDDATSVITSEEDDCISPGYHTSLPMEVHGSCYSDMQMISRASYQKLKCPTVIVTQHSLDLEAFTFHVANYLCLMNKKKYGIFYDWACEMIHVCPLSCIITLLLMVHFTARDQLPPSLSKQCYNCTSNLDCVFHRKLYQCQILFTWNIETGEWNVLDYGTLLEVTDKKNSSELNAIAQQIAKELKAELEFTGDSQNHLSVLDCCNEKPKLFLRDLRNSIEFYRNAKKYNLNFDHFD